MNAGPVPPDADDVRWRAGYRAVDGDSMRVVAPSAQNWARIAPHDVPPVLPRTWRSLRPSAPQVMSDTDHHALTRILRSWQLGDTNAAEALVPLVYDELRRLAAARLRVERGGHTLQPTALVNEAWMRLSRQHESVWQNRAHFFGIAAQAMRRILVDHARRRHAARRSGGAVHVPVDDGLPAQLPDDRLLALDQALERLESLDPRQARVVELRFFTGLSVDEAAHVLDISPGTVKRDWRTARAWLFNEVDRA